MNDEALRQEISNEVTGIVDGHQGEAGIDAILAAIQAHYQPLLAEAERRGRVDENRIAYGWPRDKGLQYFEERLRKRQATLAALVPKQGTEEKHE